jgi:hypothetical protein
LGECLTTQKRYAGAEPLVLENYRIIVRWIADERDPPRVEARRRLKALYEAWNKPEKAATY